MHVEEDAQGRAIVARGKREENLMSTWWLWRTRPAPKGPKVVNTFELPWNYVSSPRRSDDWQDLVDGMREKILPNLRRPKTPGPKTPGQLIGQEVHWNRADRGQMIAVAIQQLGRGGKQFMLTPPIEKFVDLSDFYPGFAGRSGVIHPAFWIQPEVFAAVGDVYQGASVEQIYPISFSEVQEYAKTNEAGGFILAALDAYQETGRPKQAFLKASGAAMKKAFLKTPGTATTRGASAKKTSAQLQREIDKFIGASRR
jgi:hypothetical protein